MNRGIIIGAIVILIVVGAAYLLTNSNSTATPQSTSIQSSLPTTHPSTLSTTVQTTSIAVQPSAPQKLEIAYNAIVGNYITNSTGWALYMFANDTRGSRNSSCYGGCAVYWPPFYSSNLTTVSGINASLITVINRTGGTKQDVYNGYPLYYFLGDKQAGEVKGQGVAGTWFVLAPSGNVVSQNLTTTTIAATTQSSSTTTVGGYGGYG